MAETKTRAPRTQRKASVPVEFKNLQLRLSATDSMDTTFDSNGKLIPGQFVSPQSMVGEVNRLLGEGFELLTCIPVGQEKIGANVTGVNVKIIMARGGNFKPQKAFSFMLVEENPSRINSWATEMSERFNRGFALFGEPKSIAFSRAGVNMWYTFVKR